MNLLELQMNEGGAFDRPLRGRVMLCPVVPPHSRWSSCWTTRPEDSGLAFDSWCALQTARIRASFETWEQDRQRKWLVIESRIGWWSQYRQRPDEC